MSSSRFSHRSILRRGWSSSRVVALTAMFAALLPVPAARAVVTPEWRQEAESFSTKSTGAQFSDANASGGKAYNVWTNGYIQTTFTAVTAGAKQVDVVARGDVAAGVWPVMKISVDGTAFAEQAVSSATYRTYSATLPSLSSGNHTLKIEFTNDAMPNGEDRNLKVDVASVIPSGVEEWRQEAESMSHTAGGLASDGSASGGQYWNLWSNGYLETTTVNVAASGTKQVVVYARGNVAGGVWPNMRIWVDGVQLANHTVGTTTWQPYVTTTTMSKGTHTLRVEFTNDAVINGEDRNLKVDVASLVPVANEWRREAESFDTKNTSTGIATSSVLASGGTFWNQHSNGYVQHTMYAASSGRKAIHIVARGFPYAGVYPQLKVWRGTTLLTTLTVDSQAFTQYVVPATMNVGANTLKLEFTNNASGGGEDRNVHLDVATLVGDNAFPFVQSIPFPANNSYVGTGSPLVATYADPDGDAGFVDFEVYVSSTGTSAGSGRSASTNAGDVALWTPTAVVNGTTYKWRARAFDGTSYAGAWTAYQFFTVDSVAPVAPSVSSTTFPSVSWSGTDTTSGAFTFSPGASTDVVGYKYGLDTSPPTTDTTSTSATLTPGEGPHHLYVQSVDRAGNLSTVTDYAFNAGSGAVTSPRAGDVTAKRVVLRTTAKPALIGVTYQWRRAAADAWVDVPAADVTMSGTGVTWPVTLAGGTHTDLVWDASATLGGVDGPFEARALYNDASTTRGTRIQLDQRTAGAASMPAGPGSVNLLTGNLSVSSTDVQAASPTADLTVSRTFSSRDVNAAATGPFGPGWATGVSVDGAMSSYANLTASGNLRTVTLANGDPIGFTAASTNSFTPEPGMEFLTLTRTAGSATPSDQTDDVYDLTDTGGNKTVFTWQSTAFVPATVVEAGNSFTTAYTYQTVSGVSRVTRVLAPVPSGVSCATPDATRGCRSLVFDYAASSTPLPGPSGGDYPDRLRAISLVAWDPALAAMRSVELSHYSYLPSGRLLAAWDAALPSLKTTYAYDAAGRLTTLTAPGEEPWTFAYTTLPNDADGGRLKSVSRSALTAGTATMTFVYRVPLSGTGAPADLSGTQLARWGQTDMPVDATAVFPPTQVPDGDQATGVLPTSYERATVQYLDVSGRTVDVLTPGGNIAVTEFDTHGNAIRLLSASNRARALDASSTDTAATEAALASRYSTLRTYGAEGQQLLDELGPEHEVALGAAVTDSIGRAWPAGALVRARAHTGNTYDEGAPGGTGPYHLVTTTRTSARIVDTTTDADTRTKAVTYDWTLRMPTSMTIDPNGLNLVARASYDATTGLLVKETRPSGTAAQDTAATTVKSYYTAGAHPAHAECGDHAEWANLPCRTDVAAQPTVTVDRPAIPSHGVQYDLFDAPTTMIDKDGATVLRTATVQYDSAHRPWRASTTGTGDALQTVETYYDPSTGNGNETRTIDGTGAVTARITRVFDSLGRVTSYTDADGNTSTATYDLMSRPVTTTDGKGTQTRYYDEGTERRGLLSRLVDSAAGTFSATYDTDNALATVTLPNGLVRTTSRDEAGTTVRMAYAKGASIWLAFDATSTVHGQWAAASSSGLSSQSFTYDAAGRLAKVADTVAGIGCTLRDYTTDPDSNRTSAVSREPNSEGQCDPGASGSTTSSTYDAASRITTTGYVYDALGRTTSVPAGDAGGKSITQTYSVNDLVRTLTPQDGATRTWTLDPSGQRFRSAVDGAVTKVNHYSGDADSPAWIDESGGAWTRNVAGIDGGLAAVQSSASGVLLQLVDLHGHVVATATTDPLATVPTETFESTEFGSPRDGTVRRYAWHGDKQRATDSSGVMLMGVRLYNPSTGRFLQVDPVRGGSANDYDYGNADPVNNADPSGLAYCWTSLCTKMYWQSGTNVAHTIYFNYTAKEIATLQAVHKWGGLWTQRSLRWSTDGCSSVGKWMNWAYGSLWGPACGRHDFGYRNHTKIFATSSWWDRFKGKDTIDWKFYKDMTAACSSRYPNWWQWLDRQSCNTGSETTYSGVVVFGGPAYTSWN